MGPVIVIIYSRAVLLGYAAAGARLGHGLWQCSQRFVTGTAWAAACFSLYEDAEGWWINLCHRIKVDAQDDSSDGAFQSYLEG